MNILQVFGMQRNHAVESYKLHPTSQQIAKLSEILEAFY